MGTLVASDRILPVHLWPLDSDGKHGVWTYAVAGQRLRIDRPVRQLTTWLEGSTREELSDVPATAPNEGRLIHAGPGYIADAWREVACYRELRGYRVTVAGVGSLLVAGSGASIVLLETAPGASDWAIEDTLLGPALILALALRDTWCLHAGAAMLGERAVAFVGESGRGKSTLAAYLGRGGRLLADDILPVVADGGRLAALPRYPQLRLSPEQQTPHVIPPRATLAAVYVLTENTGEEITLQPLSSRQAALALVRHTVAARLFDETLLARHLAFCTAAAAHVPLRQLSFPRRLDALPQVAQRIATDLHG